MTLGNCAKTECTGVAMKKPDLMLLFTVCLVVASAARAGETLPLTTEYSSDFNYYGADQPFAHPAPPSAILIPPGSYTSTSPGEFIPSSSQHVFHDSLLPTIASARVQVFIRTYDADLNVYMNEEVLNPSCTLECLSQQGPRLE
jgi:hypothetical protein